MTTLSISVAMLVLLSSVTGAIMVVFWYFIGLILERIGFANIVFELLKMVVVFFLLPIAYVGLAFYNTEIGRGYLFSPTPAIMDFSRKFVLLWIIGACLFMLFIITDILWVHYKYRDAFPCQKIFQNIFDELKRKMNLERSPLCLVQSYRAKTPCLVGVRKPRILLPVEGYTEEELRVILSHEMTHYKQKDVILKHVAFLVLAIHYINPFAWMLIFKIQKWSEFACDLAASKLVGGINEYFKVIMCITMESPLKSGLTSHLAENQHELMERVRKLMRISKMKKRSRMSVVLVLSMAFVLSSTTVYAASVECAEAYVNVESRTAVESSVVSSDSANREVMVETGTSEGIIIVEGEMIEQDARGVEGFEWSVPAGHRVYGSYFKCEADSEVHVMVTLDPRYVTIRLGIEDSNGVRYYVEDYDSIYQIFEISTAGRYRIYMQNDRNTDVTATGSIITR